MTKILIAEDETDIRELIRLTLTFSGFNVTLARDGQEAIELAPSDDFDLIMMDVRMPRKTGYEACREIKQNARFQDTPVIFLTARGQETEMQEGLDAGATAYILKPFAPDELIRKINQVLAQTA
jgi:DNA-binding response OmpR family regulator